MYERKMAEKGGEGGREWRNKKLLEEKKRARAGCNS